MFKAICISISISFFLSCEDKPKEEEIVLPVVHQYTSYFTGNTMDKKTSPKGGVCLMGGSSEDDNALRWFLNQSDGGDILVLRASGSNGYNDYMYSDLGVSINSVEAIVVKNKDASFDTTLHRKINQAEGIWFAGGNQWNYVNYWRGTPIDSLINAGINNRNIVIGGTSAGMAILGKYIFSAKNGTVTSEEALGNPYHNDVSIDSIKFLGLKYLDNVITDTHYSQRSREGRHVTFLARLVKDFGVNAKGIAADERTAITIGMDGIAKVYGESNKAFFIQMTGPAPESCVANQPLNWSADSTALKVYEVKGTSNGSATFNLDDWETGSGGAWHHWFVIDGKFNSKSF